MGEMLTCTLTFERPSSPSYREAVRLARSMAGYRLLEREGRASHTVPVTIDTLPAAERLLRLVAGWRAAVVCVVTPGHPV